MMTKVAEVATIRNGFAFRGRIESEDDGDTRVIQPSDLTRNLGDTIDLDCVIQVGNALDPDSLVQYLVLDKRELICRKLGKKGKRYHLGVNDILFSSRGSRQIAYRPVCVPFSEEPVVSSHGLFVITAIQKKIEPAYLHWVLNTRSVQRRIEVYKEGTSISFISERNLGAVEIPLPSKTKQKKIVELISLQERRARLRRQLVEKDKKIIEATAWSLATGQ